LPLIDYSSDCALRVVVEGTRLMKRKGEKKGVRTVKKNKAKINSYSLVQRGNPSGPGRGKKVRGHNGKEKEINDAGRLA